MISADHDPGRGFQKRFGRLKEVRLPSLPTIGFRATVTLGLLARRTRGLAVLVVSDVNDQVGARGCCGSRDTCERPFVFAVLNFFIRHAAAAITDDDDAPWVRSSNGKYL